MFKSKEVVVTNLIQDKYKKYYKIVYNYVKNEDDALDVVQEGAYKAILHCKKLKNIEYADTWICRIMINEAIKFLKKNNIYHDDILKCDISTNDSYENIDLKEAFESLEVKDKAIIELRFFEDMTLEDIAYVLNENISTVKSRLYRALNKLKISLKN